MHRSPCALLCLAAWPAAAQEILVHDAVPIMTEDSDGFGRFQPHPSAGSNWPSPTNYFDGEFHIRYELLDCPGGRPLRFNVCIRADVEDDVETEWKETCSPHRLSPGEGVYTSVSAPSRWWRSNEDEPVDFARVADFRLFALALRSASGGNVGPWVPFRHHIVDHRPPQNPWTKIVGDLDGDGKPDLVVGGQRGPLVWYRGPDWDRFLIASGEVYRTVDGEVGDIDGDGDLDIVMGGTVWFENPGDLRRTPQQEWKRHVIADRPTHDVRAADFDGDGRLDVAARDQSSFGRKLGDRIHVWLQRPQGRSEERVIECPHGEGIAAADLDRDGDPDIVIGGIWFGTVRESGRANWIPRPYGDYPDAASLALGDFNADGRLDIAVAPAELAGQHGRIVWFEAPADPRLPNWREHVIHPRVERVYHSLAVADMDGDGSDDVIFAEMHQGADPDEVGFYLNLGQGRRWFEQVVAMTGSHCLRAVDLDGDGDIDLFGANWSGERQPVEIWENLRR